MEEATLMTPDEITTGLTPLMLSTFREKHGQAMQQTVMKIVQDGLDQGVLSHEQVERGGFEETYLPRLRGVLLALHGKFARVSHFWSPSGLTHHVLRVWGSNLLGDIQQTCDFWVEKAQPSGDRSLSFSGLQTQEAILPPDFTIDTIPMSGSLQNEPIAPIMTAMEERQCAYAEALENQELSARAVAMEYLSDGSTNDLGTDVLTLDAFAILAQSLERYALTDDACGQYGKPISTVLHFILGELARLAQRRPGSAVANMQPEWSGSTMEWLLTRPLDSKGRPISREEQHILNSAMNQDWSPLASVPAGSEQYVAQHVTQTDDAAVADAALLYGQRRSSSVARWLAHKSSHAEGHKPTGIKRRKSRRPSGTDAARAARGVKETVGGCQHFDKMASTPIHMGFSAVDSPWNDDFAIFNLGDIDMDRKMSTDSGYRSGSL